MRNLGSVSKSINSWGIVKISRRFLMIDFLPRNLSGLSEQFLFRVQLSNAIFIHRR